MNGAAAKIAMAKPRCDAGNKSAMTPPALVNGDDPNVPALSITHKSVYVIQNYHSILSSIEGLNPNA